MFFLPLVKADAEKRLVFARAAMEEPDKSREIMDYVSARPQFEAWSKQYSDATLGKSLGNIRAMHNPRHLAGKVQDIIYDDANKTVDVCLKVLDPVDWAKVEEGGYTGLSIGGGYIRKWSDTTDPTLTRYTPRIAEISLVDSPCMPSARIMELQKSEGETVEVLLKGVPRLFDDLKPPPTFDDLNKLGFHPIQSLKEGGMADLTGSNSIHYGYLHGLFSDLPKTRAARLLANQKKPKTPQPPKPPTAPMGPAKQEAEGDLGKNALTTLAKPSYTVVRNTMRHLGQVTDSYSSRGKSFTDQNPAELVRPEWSHTNKQKKFSGEVEPGKRTSYSHRGKTFTSGDPELMERSEPIDMQKGFWQNLFGLKPKRPDGSQRLNGLWKPGPYGKQEPIDFDALLEKSSGWNALGEGLRAMSNNYVQRQRGAAMQAEADAAVKPKKPRKPKQAAPVPAVPAMKSELDFDNLLEKAKTSPEEREKIRLTMHEFKHGSLRSFRSNLPKRKMPKVTNRKQAIAIALSQARRMGKQDEAQILEGILLKAHPQDYSSAYGSRMDSVKRGAGVGASIGSLLGAGGGPGGVLTGVAGGTAIGAGLGALAHGHEQKKVGRESIKEAGKLSEKQHQQRIAAAKARWLKEDHHDLDPIFDQQHAHASKATLGRKEKVASVAAHRTNAWNAVADAQDAYDKARKHMPAHHSLMMEVPHMGGLLYNPEGVGESHFNFGGKPSNPMYLLHPSEVNDWIAKHGNVKSKKQVVFKSEPLGLITHIRQITERVAAA
jgi:hypothetical protein